jgi:hypothetical protein
MPILSEESLGSDRPLHLLVEDCLRSNDPSLWGVLVQRLQPLFACTVYRVATGTPSARLDEVDDLVQESFLAARV